MLIRNVIGTKLACTDYSGAVGWIFEKMSQADRAYAVEAANTHVVSLARSDAEFGAAMAKFDLIVPDGMPLIWRLNWELPDDQKLKDRVYGPTLMERTLEASPGKPARHFLLGGSPQTLEKLTSAFSERFPETVIAGVYSPPFGEWPEDEFEKICEGIRSSKANLIWVGLGCPKQEKWIAANLENLPAGVYFGIGAAFAFHAGEVKQAPAFLQKIGMEWFFRLAMEPRRLWKRYFVHNSRFIYYLLEERMKQTNN